MDSTAQDRDKNKNNPSPTSSPHSNVSSNGSSTPKQQPITASNPFPTTFVQADTSTFKQVVQILTGSTVARNNGGGGCSIPPIKSTRKHELLSPSILDFPSLVIGPGTPLKADNDGYNSCESPFSEVEEDRAIAQKKFYFHPSPRTNAEPQLLSLFPVTSPRLADSSACLTNGENSQ